MEWGGVFIFIGWFLLCFLACSFIGLLMIGIIVGILLLLEFNVYVAAGIIIGIIALCMTIDIMKED
mgnify:FL=1